MLDRLVLPSVSLPQKTYARAIVVQDPSSSSSTNVDDTVLGKVHDSLLGNGRIEYERRPDNTMPLIFAGFLVEQVDGRVCGIKVADEGEVVSLGKKKATTKRKSDKIAIVDFGDDLDDLVDEETLLDEADLKNSIRIRASSFSPYSVFTWAHN